MAKPLFNLPPAASRSKDARIHASTRNAKNSGQVKLSGSGNLIDRIKNISALVTKELGYLEDQVILIRDEESLHDYISDIIRIGHMAYDTETSSVDILTLTLAGLCLYAPGLKAAYVPLNHISYITGVKLKNQVSMEFAKKELQRLVDAGITRDMHTGKFDYGVTRETLDILIPPTFDAYSCKTFK